MNFKYKSVNAGEIMILAGIILERPNSTTGTATTGVYP
jgi:hypothetical protein